MTPNRMPGFYPKPRPNRIHELQTSVNMKSRPGWAPTNSQSRATDPEHPRSGPGPAAFGPLTPLQETQHAIGQDRLTPQSPDSTGSLRRAEATNPKTPIRGIPFTDTKKLGQSYQHTPQPRGGSTNHSASARHPICLTHGEYADFQDEKHCPEYLRESERVVCPNRPQRDCYLQHRESPMKGTDLPENLDPGMERLLGNPPRTDGSADSTPLPPTSSPWIPTPCRVWESLQFNPSYPKVCKIHPGADPNFAQPHACR